MNSISPSSRPPFPQTGEGGNERRVIQRTTSLGDNPLTAPVTPEKRLPVVDKSKVDPQTLKAAEGMEAMFLDYMMNQMRKTVHKESMDLENTGTEVYRSMLDSEVAQKAARAGGIGLADQIVAYLESQRYNYMQGQGVPQPNHGGSSGLDTSNSGVDRSTGGTHAGQPIRK
ncbi:MAG: rod-binding protein [Bdellovibrionia bacterium]